MIELTGSLIAPANAREIERAFSVLEGMTVQIRNGDTIASGRLIATRTSAKLDIDASPLNIEPSRLAVTELVPVVNVITIPLNESANYFVSLSTTTAQTIAFTDYTAGTKVRLFVSNSSACNVNFPASFKNPNGVNFFSTASTRNAMVEFFCLGSTLNDVWALLPDT